MKRVPPRIHARVRTRIKKERGGSVTTIGPVEGTVKGVRTACTYVGRAGVLPAVEFTGPVPGSATTYRSADGAGVKPTSVTVA